MTTRTSDEQCHMTNLKADLSIEPAFSIAFRNVPAVPAGKTDVASADKPTNVLTSKAPPSFQPPQRQVEESRRGWFRTAQNDEPPLKEPCREVT